MVLDVTLLIFCILAFIRGWQKGLLWAICSMIAVIVGIVLAMKLSSDLAAYLFRQQILSNQYTLLVSFVLIFIASILLFRLLIRFVEAILDKLLLGWANRIAGAFLYVFFVIFFFSTFCWLLNEAGVLNKEVKSGSKTYAYIEPVATKTIDLVTENLPYFRELIGKVRTHFTEITAGKPEANH